MRRMALACAVWLGCEQRPRSDITQRELLNPLKPLLVAKPEFVEPEDESIEKRYNRHCNNFPGKLREAFEAVLYQDDVEGLLDVTGAAMSSAHFQQVCHLLRHYDKLTTVILEGNRISRQEMTMLCESLLTLERLEDLDLCDCAIGDEGAEELSKYLPRFKDLRQLRLSRNGLSSKSIVAVCRAMHNSKLVSLWLSHNSLGEEGALALGDMLPRVKLEVLGLADTSCGPKEMALIAPGIQRSRRLKDLMLNDNPLCTEGVRAVSTRLPDSLEKMDFAGTKMDSVGADLLSTGMSFIKGLHELYLENNSIGDSGVKAFSIPLRTYSEMKNINISNNGITSLGYPFIVWFFDRSKKMRTFRATNSRFGHAANKFYHDVPHLLHLDLRECHIYSHMGFHILMPGTFLELSTQVEF